MGGPRDIDVLFLGAAGSRRRRALLRTVQGELEVRGLRLTVHDVSGGYLEGPERTRYLNRVRIVLNLLKRPADWTGHRLLLGMANKALVVSEPLVDCGPFQPGRHFVMAAPAELPQTLAYYLDHESERQSIADEAFRFVRTELAMSQMCQRILSSCRKNILCS